MSYQSLHWQGDLPDPGLTDAATISGYCMIPNHIACITQYGSTGYIGMALVFQCVHKEIVIFTFNVHLFGLLAASLWPYHQNLSLVKNGSIWTVGMVSNRK